MTLPSNPIAQALKYHKGSGNLPPMLSYVSESFFRTLEALPLVTAGAEGDNARVLAMVADRAPGDSWTYGNYESLARWEQAMREGDKGARELLEKLRASLAPSLATPLDTRRRTVRGADGDALCPIRVMQGDLDRAWSRRVRATGRAPQPIKIVCALTANSGTGAEAFRIKGATALALAAALGAAGYKVSVWACDIVRTPFGQDRRRNKPLTAVVAHEVSSNAATLDAARALAVMSSVHLRRVSFMIWAASEWRLDYSIGHAEYRDPEIAMTLARAGVTHAGDNVIVVPSSLTGERAAREWLAHTSKQFA